MKSSYGNSLTVSSVALLLLSTSLWISDSYGMESEESESSSRKIAQQPAQLHIISPEMVELRQRLAAYERHHPKVAGGRVCIQDQADFKSAMEYLVLKEKEASIFQACIIGSMSNPLAVKASLYAEANLNAYIKYLLENVNPAFRTKEDQAVLRHALGKGYVRFGFATLEEFALAVKTTPLSQAQSLLNQVFQIRKLLAVAPDLPYPQEFEQNLRLRLPIIFSGKNLNSSLLDSIPDLRRIIDEGQKEVQGFARASRHLKLDEFRDSYDLYFQGKSFQIAQQFNDIVMNPPSNALESLKETMNRYFELEREGLRFKEGLKEKVSSPTIELNEETLTEFYIFMTQRLSHLPNKDPVEALPHIILSLVTADQKEEALKRLNVLQNLYLKRGYIPEKFRQFRAKVKAMCSDFEEMNQLIFNEGSSKLTEQQLRKREKNRLKRQKQRKRKQEAKFASQGTALPILEVKEEIVQVVKEPVESPLLITKEAEDIKPSLPALTEVAEEVLPASQKTVQEKDKKLKRHQEAQMQREENQSLKSTAVGDKSPPRSMNVSAPLKKRTQDIVFSFGPKSFKILNQLFADDWKVSRKDIESFFEEIGQEVNRKTGSSHHIIKISKGVAIKRDGQMIGMVSDLSSNMTGHISLPRWEKTVPLYIQREVMKLIDLMGITKDNYKKG